MPSFEDAYTSLNPKQRQAVDQIDGPVLVIAGPGTGKTQLLSMRVANILRQADVTAQNILCLTFTEDAARNMRDRLAGIIGQAAYDVTINTFHGFGAAVISRYGEYFYQGIGAQPIDDLASHQIFSELFKNLPHDNPLAMQYEGEFLYLRGARDAIDNFKTAGLAPDEVRAVAKNNLDFTAIANSKISLVMEDFARIDKTSPQRFERLLIALREVGQTPRNTLPTFIKPLSELTIEALTAAVETCQDSGKTTSLTEFKNKFLIKNNTGQWQLKDGEASKKLLALADLYEQYLLKLREANLLDFNDMITRVVHALELAPELRLNLQEQYQYILVDEFQDTSLAQLRIIQALTNNPVFEGRPNILAVGDDDQAIYSFQGAELSNILSFHQLYNDVEVITLTENYRSRQDILDAAQFVIQQSSERLVHTLENITKDITAKNSSLPEAFIAHHRFASADQQYQWVAAAIANKLSGGLPASEIAVIAPKHSGLKAIAPFLQARNIPTFYQKRENILEVPAIAQLVTTAKLITLLADNRQKEADALLPEVLSYEFWGLSTRQIWQLYLGNYRKRSPWLEIALQNDDQEVQRVVELLQFLAIKAKSESLEHLLDVLAGNATYQQMHAADTAQISLFSDQELTSPFYNFYFSEAAQKQNSQQFIELISHLTFLRNRLRDFYASEKLTLYHFVEYVSLCQSAGLQLVDTTPHRENPEAVSLHTAHSAKGLEFRAVYLIDTNHDIWTSTNHQGKIAMPVNLPIERASSSEDERRRLLFVAMTRAKHDLLVTGFDSPKRGNAPLKYLTGADSQEVPAVLQPQSHSADAADSQTLQNELLTRWHDRHLAARSQADMRALLAPILQNYRLSATHLQTFLNVAEGGPQKFFIECLLHFPKAGTPQMAFGNAVHQMLDSAHKYLKKEGNPKDTEGLLQEFAELLRRYHLQPDEEAKWIETGYRILPQYLAARYPEFSPQEYFEFDLSHRNLIIDGVHVTGKIDRITPLGNNSYRVTDFKTGAPITDWNAKGLSVHKQIQLHQYQQQLTLYRLLVEESRAFGQYTAVTEAAIDFVRPNQTGEVGEPLPFAPTDDDILRLRRLIRAVWQRITTLDMPDISGYSKSLQGVLEFEEFLLAELGDK